MRLKLFFICILYSDFNLTLIQGTLVPKLTLGPFKWAQIERLGILDTFSRVNADYKIYNQHLLFMARTTIPKNYHRRSFGGVFFALRISSILHF